MRRWAAVGVVIVLGGCAGASVSLPPKTVTVTKTQSVYPPDALYSADGNCKQVPTRTKGTVKDLANDYIDERANMAVCIGDRDALRDWVKSSRAIK